MKIIIIIVSDSLVKGIILAYSSKGPGLIAGSAMAFFSSVELLHGLYILSFPVFQCHFSTFCPVFSSEEDPALS